MLCFLILLVHKVACNADFCALMSKGTYYQCPLAHFGAVPCCWGQLLPILAIKIAGTVFLYSLLGSIFLIFLFLARLLPGFFTPFFLLFILGILGKLGCDSFFLGYSFFPFI